MVSDQNWQNVIFSDESSFEVFDSKKRQHCYRPDGTGLEEKYLQPTVKHGGGKIMVWGCISWSGTGRLVVVDKKLDAAGYINILSNNLQQSAHEMNLDHFLF